MNAFASLVDQYAAASSDVAAAELALALAADRRAAAVAEMADRGLSLAQIGVMLDISSRGRVGELVRRGRAVLDPVEIVDCGYGDVSAVLEELRGRVRAEAGEIGQRAADTLPGGRDDLRMRRPESVMGETDFLGLLARAERDRLTRFGAWVSSQRGQTPDNLAQALRDAGFDSHSATDDQILADVWVPITRTIDAATVVARGNLPNPRRLPGVNLDNLAPTVAAEGWHVRDLLGDDATAYVAEVLTTNQQTRRSTAA